MKNEVGQWGAILPDKNCVEDKGMVVILGQRDDEATVGELQAATARSLYLCGTGEKSSKLSPTKAMSTY